MRYPLFVLLFVFYLHSTYASPFSDWAYETNNGNTIGDTGGGTGLLTNTNEELENLSRWYFYSDHIIGEYDTFIDPEYKTAYFILNELNGELKTYTSKELFEKELQAQKLKPIFWTRWHHDHYKITQIVHIILLTLWFYYWHIAIMVILIISLCILTACLAKNKILKIICIVISSIPLIPIILSILNDYWITSI